MIFRRPIVAAGVGLLIVFTSGSCEMHRGSDGESGIVTVVHDGDTVQIRLDDGRRETVG